MTRVVILDLFILQRYVALINQGVYSYAVVCSVLQTTNSQGYKLSKHRAYGCVIFCHSALNEKHMLPRVRPLVAHVHVVVCKTRAA